MIKILSGLHTGAEYYLPAGVTRLGKSAQCDLILHDKGIAEELFVFTCTGESVQVHHLAQDSPVLLDGMEQTSPFTITDFGLLTCSALYLAVGAEDKPWKIPAPTQLFVQPEDQVRTTPEVGEEEEAPADNEEQEDMSDDDAEDRTDNNWEGNVPEPETAIEMTRNRPAAAGLRLEWLWRFWPPQVGLYRYQDESQAPAQPAARISLKQIKAIAERYNLDASFELNKNNILSVEGYALNAEDEHGVPARYV